MNMPCRCCNASKPSKGFTNTGESEINDHLKKAAKLINDKFKEFDDIDDWVAGWKEAFDHHLNGCPEKGNEHA